MKRKGLMLLIGGLLTAVLLAGCSEAATPNEEEETKGPVTGMQNAAGDLVIPLDEISKDVTIFAVNVDGTEMEVIAAYTSDGQLRTAFNTCSVCYDSGYGYFVPKGNKISCQNCGNTYTVDQFDTVKKRSCQPWAITDEERTVTDDTLTISIDFLRSSIDIFASWKV